MAIREGRWLCLSCGSENRGGSQSCSGLLGQDGCGIARPEGIKFYLPENSPIVTDSQKLAEANAGQNWYCDHCTGANKNAYNGKRTLQCVHCGDSRDKSDPSHGTNIYQPGTVPTTPPKPVRKRNNERILPTPDLLGQQKHLLLYTGIGLAVLSAVVVIWYLFLATFEISTRVENFNWERTVTIEKYTTLQEEDWSIPSGGREQSREVKIRSYRQVLDHYDSETRQVSEQVATGSESYTCGTRDLGNGYFSDITCSRNVYTTQYRTETYQQPVYRDEPVYDTWYIYHIERWVYNRIHRSSASDRYPYWPAYSLASRLERVSATTEAYSVGFLDNEGEDYSADFSEAEWNSFLLNQAVVLIVNRAGMVLKAEH